MLVKPMDLYLYGEVWEILEWRNSQIWKTRTTGKFVRKDWRNPDPNKWLVTSVTTKLLTSSVDVELEMFSL